MGKAVYDLDKEVITINGKSYDESTARAVKEAYDIMETAVYLRDTYKFSDEEAIEYATQVRELQADDPFISEGEAIDYILGEPDNEEVAS